jgi:hypothetical protein
MVPKTATTTHVRSTSPVQYNISLKNGSYLFLYDIVSTSDGRDELGDYIELEDTHGNELAIYRSTINSMVRVVQPEVEVIQ